MRKINVTETISNATETLAKNLMLHDLKAVWMAIDAKGLGGAISLYERKLAHWTIEDGKKVWTDYKAAFEYAKTIDSLFVRISTKYAVTVISMTKALATGLRFIWNQLTLAVVSVTAAVKQGLKALFALIKKALSGDKPLLGRLFRRKDDDDDIIIEAEGDTIEAEAAPIEEEAAPVEAEAAPIEEEYPPIEEEDIPAEVKAAPAEKKPAKVEKKPVKAENTPAEKKPAKKEEKPAEKKPVKKEEKGGNAPSSNWGWLNHLHLVDKDALSNYKYNYSLVVIGKTKKMYATIEYNDMWALMSVVFPVVFNDTIEDVDPDGHEWFIEVDLVNRTFGFSGDSAGAPYSYTCNFDGKYVDSYHAEADM